MPGASPNQTDATSVSSDRQILLARFDSVITLREDLRLRVARRVAGSSARNLLELLDGQAVRLPIDRQLHPNPQHLRWHHGQVFKGEM